MKMIAVAPTNPVKVQAALAGFQKMFPEEIFLSEMVNAPSGVQDQPDSDEETFRGALNRARRAAELVPKADYWVGIEGGVQECTFTGCADEMMAFAWVVILKTDAAKEQRGKRMKDGSANEHAVALALIPFRNEELYR